MCGLLTVVCHPPQGATLHMLPELSHVRENQLLSPLAPTLWAERQLHTKQNKSQLFLWFHSLLQKAVSQFGKSYLQYQKERTKWMGKAQ